MPSGGAPSIFELPGRLGDVEQLAAPDWPSPALFRDEHAPCRHGDHLLARQRGEPPWLPAGRPVVLLGAAAAMPAYERWRDDARLRGSYGAAILDNVELAKTETRAAGEIKGVRLDAFLRHYGRGEAGGADRGAFELYSVASLPTRMRADVLLPTPLSAGGYTRRLVEALLWFSSGGTASVVHADAEDNFLCLFDGSKRLALWRPEFGAQIESAALGWRESSAADATYGGFGGPPNLDLNRLNLTRFPGWAALQVCVYVCVSVSMHVGMCVCIYVRIRMCLFICMHVCIYACMYLCMWVCVDVCMSVCKHACMHAGMDACMSVCMHVCISACMHVCMHACMLACMYVCIYACVYACMQVCIYVYMCVCV